MMINIATETPNIQHQIMWYKEIIYDINIYNIQEIPYLLHPVRMLKFPRKYTTPHIINERAIVKELN